MNLQLALDRLTKEDCIRLVEETKEYLDWIEIGTGVIKEYGMEIIREMKKLYPEKTIVADMKTCDAGRAEAVQAFSAGADITTVMAFSANKTILDTLEVAKEFGKEVMVDLLGVQEKERIQELEKMKVKFLSLHIGKDLQQSNVSIHSQFELVKSFTTFKYAVAGGINLQTLPSIVEFLPHTIIVGSAIAKAERPKEIASIMKEMMMNDKSHH